MPATPNKHSLILRDQDTITADMDGELVMINIERGNYYGLGAIGSRIWQLLENPVRVDELCRQLTTEYQVDPQSCEADVIGFLQQLQQAGLVTFSHGDSA